MTRPDRDEWHLRGAAWLAEQGDCTRRKVGALIVGPDKRFWGLGYNGTAPGADGCLDGACPRGRHYPIERALSWLDDGEEYVGEFEVCAGCVPRNSSFARRIDIPRWPCPDAVAPGSSYDTGPGACIATHAEMNAMDDAKTRGAGRMAGGTLYVSTEPCDGCIRYVRNNTDIKAVIWPEGMVALP